MTPVTLTSVVTCPCGHQAEETMPETSCQVRYQCEACGRLLTPGPGDCCIYCTYGSVPCPPIQREQDCDGDPQAPTIPVGS